MKRREFVKNASLGALALSASSRAIASSNKKDHSGHMKARKTNKKLDAIVASTAECLKLGNICNAHCMELISKGDSSLYQCQMTVQNMIPVISAMQTVSALQNSGTRNMRDLARVCIRFCKDCRDACKPHADHHKECADCMRACADCIKACEDYA